MDFHHQNNNSLMTPMSSQPQNNNNDSQQRSAANNNNSNNLSKANIVEWVNTSIDPPQSYTCVKDIPSKVAAAVASLDESHPPEDVTLYLSMCAEQWPDIEEVTAVWQMRS